MDMRRYLLREVFTPLKKIIIKRTKSQKQVESVARQTSPQDQSSTFLVGFSDVLLLVAGPETPLLIILLNTYNIKLSSKYKSLHP